MMLRSFEFRLLSFVEASPSSSRPGGRKPLIGIQGGQHHQLCTEERFRVLGFGFWVWGDLTSASQTKALRVK